MRQDKLSDPPTTAYADFLHRGLIILIGNSILLYKRVEDLLLRALVLTGDPGRWLLGKIETADTGLVEKAALFQKLLRSAGWWLLSKLLRLCYWATALVVIGPLILIYVIIFLGFWFGFLYLFVFKPFEYTEWVGAYWIGAVIVWIFLAPAPNRWWAGFGRISLYVIVGVTPQFIFLCVYNGLQDAEFSPPTFIQTLINGYEYLTVWTYTKLRPVKELEWYWWALAAIGLLCVSFVLNRPRVLTTSLQLRKALSSLVFITWVTVSLSLSSAVPVGNWQPDIEARLRADLREEVRSETQIYLATSLANWFKGHPGLQTRLPIYVRNFDSALREIDEHSSASGSNTKDIAAAARIAIKSLVPPDIALTLAAAMPTARAQRGEGSSSVSALLNHDREMKQLNKDLKQQADQARAVGVAFIAQVVDVSVPTIPLLKEIVGEVINTTAELISDYIAKRIPVEQAIVTSQKISHTVDNAIQSSIEEIFLALFAINSAAHPVLNGTNPEEVRNVIDREARRITSTRVQEESRAREAARRARGR